MPTVKDEIDLHTRVQHELDANPITQKMRIRVENQDGVVVLQGKVTTYYAKQMAQEVLRPLLRSVTPTPVLRNQIEVVNKGT